jgi:hypothetical protein
MKRTATILVAALDLMWSADAGAHHSVEGTFRLDQTNGLPWLGTSKDFLPPQA